ncbi:Aste57867_13002 [Aphanomyces stellatus]|uniref:Aste57867_13002 protein n=1 Tax=Aphanomyces stellatus TaxID=120398 RepID=A0A485KXX5_9STRA|nr:hypothetical protein As57867_012954 [Aphanomyces stellatus]VFT89848.1 Aste57867_13002 [Aphanomyces stellatus]
MTPHISHAELFHAAVFDGRTARVHDMLANEPYLATMRLYGITPLMRSVAGLNSKLAIVDLLRPYYMWTADSVTKLIAFACEHGARPSMVDHLLCCLMQLDTRATANRHCGRGLQIALRFRHWGLALHLVQQLVPPLCYDNSLHKSITLMLRRKYQPWILNALRLSGESTLFQYAAESRTSLVAVKWLDFAVKHRMTHVVQAFEAVACFRPLLFACCRFAPCEDRALWTGVCRRFYKNACSPTSRVILLIQRRLGLPSRIGFLVSSFLTGERDPDEVAAELWCTICCNLKMLRRGSECCRYAMDATEKEEVISSDESSSGDESSDDEFDNDDHSTQH